MNGQTLGTRIEHIRRNLGDTLEEFGNRFDPPASKGTVHTWENNLYKPNPQRLSIIASLGGVSMDLLLYGKGYTPERVRKMMKNNVDEIKKIYREHLTDILEELPNIIVGVEKKIYFDHLIELYVGLNPNVTKEKIITKVINANFDSIYANLSSAYDENMELYFASKISFCIEANSYYLLIEKVFDDLIKSLENIVIKQPEFIPEVLGEVLKNTKKDVTYKLIKPMSLEVLTGGIVESKLTEYYSDALIDTISYQDYLEIINKLNDLESFIQTLY